MKTYYFKEVWVLNYLHLRPRMCEKKDPDFYHVQIYWLYHLSRNINTYIDKNKIKTNPYAVRLCKFVYKSLVRVADWRQLELKKDDSYLSVLKQTQHRLEKLLY